MPAALDLFTWLSYRCFIAKGEERIPLFGGFGLVSRLGSGEYRRPRKFRECLESWLGLVKALWPSCPARISDDGMRLILAPAIQWWHLEVTVFAPEGAPGDWCRRIPLATIDKVVSARLGQTRVQGNAHPAVFNRQIAMYLAKHVGGWSTTRIGRFYNGRDHTTVCYALKRVATLRETDPEIDGLVSSLATEIKTALPNETGRTDAPTWTLAGANDLCLNDAFRDALADRLAVRIFDRAKGIDANGSSGAK